MTPPADSAKWKHLSENELPTPIDSFFASPSIYNIEYVNQVANQIAEAFDGEKT
jgi:hypothetical protein